MVTMLAHELRDRQKRLELRFGSSVNAMKTDADFIRRVHVRICIPDPLDKSRALDRK